MKKHSKAPYPLALQLLDTEIVAIVTGFVKRGIGETSNGNKKERTITAK